MSNFGFSNTEESMQEFGRYKKPSDSDTLTERETLNNIEKNLSKIISLLELLVKAAETELVPLRYNSGLQTLTTAVTTVPDPDNTTPTNGGYTVIDVAIILERKSPELYFLNEGPGVIYVRVLKNKNDSSTNEDIVFEGETKTFYDVFELRIRSTSNNTKYRVTEYEPFKQRDFSYKTGLSYVSETNVAVVGVPNVENIVTSTVAPLGLGRFATTGYLINDGPGNLEVEVSVDGTNYGNIITLIPNQILEFEEEIYSLRIDATVAATAYRLNVH